MTEEEWLIEFMMTVENMLAVVPVFMLVLFRIAGMMIFAPLFGSTRVPRVVKAMLCITLAVGMLTCVRQPVVLPDTLPMLTVALAGEIVFGLAMGMIVSFIFVAAQWAGNIAGQQMGLNLSEVFDPQFGGGGSIVGELYFMLTLVIFLSIGGHHLLLKAVAQSFETVPLLSVGMNVNVLDTVLAMLQASTALAVQLAAPVLLTLLLVDLVLGCLSKTMPQLNIMTAGLSLRSLVGLLILVLGIGVTTGVLRDELDQSIAFFTQQWQTAAASSAGP